MGIQELREKYGDVEGRTVINRAVRQEMIAGSEMIEAEFLINDLLTKSEFPDDQFHAIKKIQNKVCVAAKALRNEICRRYDLPKNETPTGEPGTVTGNRWASVGDESEKPSPDNPANGR